MMKRNRLGQRALVVLSTILLMGVAFAPTVSAEVQPGVPAPAGQANPPTASVKIVGTGSGQGLNGFMSTFAPPERISHGYPTAIESDWHGHTAGFAGLIHMQVTSGPGAGATFDAYCIDLLTDTQVGVGYKPGEWTEANVPNVGYVAQLLQSYAPTTDLPTGLTPNQQAAAVQAAIWYLSDGFVLAPTNALYPAVSAIITDVITRGPLGAPPPPSLTIDGPSFGTVNTLIGPFTVSGEAVGGVAAGVEAFTDAEGTHKLGSTFPITAGMQIWLRSAQAGIQNPALTARASVTQDGGVVYLYALDPGGKQTIIQAGPLVATTDVGVKVAFLDLGNLPISKEITGAGAGSQGPIQIDVVCSVPNSSIAPFKIPAGATGVVTTIVTGITVPARCTLTETQSGANQDVDVFADAPHAGRGNAGGSHAHERAGRHAGRLRLPRDQPAAARRDAYPALRERRRGDHDGAGQHHHDGGGQHHHDGGGQHDDNGRGQHDDCRLHDDHRDHDHDHDRRHHHHDGNHHHDDRGQYDHGRQHDDRGDRCADDRRAHDGARRVRALRADHRRAHHRAGDPACDGCRSRPARAPRPDRSRGWHRLRGADPAPPLLQLAHAARAELVPSATGTPQGPAGVVAGVLHVFRMGAGPAIRVSEPVYRKLPNDERGGWAKHQAPATYTLQI